jgi:hypothetical protein
MSKVIVFSNLGFLLGMAGVVLAVIPFFNMNNPQMYNIVLPIIFGIVGLFLAFKIKKELNDDVVKFGLVVNPLAIVLGIIQLIIYLIK